jgi:hypothetical protein
MYLQQNAKLSKVLGGKEAKGTLRITYHQKRGVGGRDETSSHC